MRHLFLARKWSPSYYVFYVHLKKDIFNVSSLSYNDTSLIGSGSHPMTSLSHYDVLKDPMSKKSHWGLRFQQKILKWHDSIHNGKPLAPSHSPVLFTVSGFPWWFEHERWSWCRRTSCSLGSSVSGVFAIPTQNHTSAGGCLYPCKEIRFRF